MKDFTQMAIKYIREEAVGTRSYFFDIPEGMTWEAGSDMHFAFPDFMASGNPDKALIRHMSLMTLPEEGKIGFTTRVPGSGSVYKKRLETLKPEDEMVMFKLGNRFPLRREGLSIVMISMGVGVAVTRSMTLQWVKDSRAIPSVTNLVVDKKNHFIFRDELKSIDNINLTNVFCKDRSSFYRNFESLPFNTDNIFYIVGSDLFLEEVIKRLKARGIAPVNIEIDKKPERKAEMLGDL